MARKNKIDKTAPSTLSALKNLFIIDSDLPCKNGMSGGSTKNFAPDLKKTVTLNANAFNHKSALLECATGGHSLVPRPAKRQKILLYGYVPAQTHDVAPQIL
jgi:hypothetical protein